MRILRLIAVFAFVLALGASQVSALPAREGAEPRQVGNHTRGVFGLLADFVITFWSKAGCTIDPLGGCAPSIPDEEAGCRIDPWGRCSADVASADAK